MIALLSSRMHKKEESGQPLEHLSDTSEKDVSNLMINFKNSLPHIYLSANCQADSILNFIGRINCN